MYSPVSCQLVQSLLGYSHKTIIQSKTLLDAPYVTDVAMAKIKLETAIGLSISNIHLLGFCVCVLSVPHAESMAFVG